MHFLAILSRLDFDQMLPFQVGLAVMHASYMLFMMVRQSTEKQITTEAASEPKRLVQPLLATKFFRPKPTHNLIQRETLQNKLSLAEHVKLTLVTAPAGYGKTTAVTHWLAERDDQLPIFWLSLDENDNDPIRFLRYLIATFQRQNLNIGEEAKAFIQSGQGSPFPQTLNVVMTLLVNDVVATYKDGFYLALDDFHLLQNEAVIQAMQTWVEYVPSHCHTIMISRASPEFPLSRWRVRGQLIEVGIDDLRFSQREACDLLTAVRSEPLGEEIVQQLVERTEGWPAGLQLAALYLRRHPTVELHHAQAFTGTHRFVADYLVEEVFAQLGEETGMLLAQLSLMKRFCAPLCTAVTSLVDSDALLKELNRDHFFLSSIDDDGYWYRFHGLVSDYLQANLQRYSQLDAQQIHEKAYHWLQNNGWEEEAINHALKAGLYDEAAAWLGQQATTIVWQTGQTRTFVSWCAQIPQEILFAQPSLALHYGWTIIFNIGLKEAETYLEQLRHTELNHFSGEELSELAILEAELALNHGDINTVVEKIDSVNFDELTQPVTITVSRQIQGYTYRLIGRVKESIAALQEAIVWGDQHQFHTTAFYARYDLCEAYAVHGRLDLAQQVSEEIFRKYGTTQHPTWPRLEMAYAEQAFIYYQQNRLDEAEQEIQKAVALMHVNDSWASIKRHALRTFAKIRQAKGEWESAQQLLEQVAELQGTRISASTAQLNAYLSLLQNELDIPSQYYRQYSAQKPPHLTSLQHHLEKVVHGRYLMATEQWSTALTWLQSCRQTAVAQEWFESVIRIDIQLAITHSHMNQPTQALMALQNALERAHTAGYIQPFVNESKLLVPLFHAAKNSKKLTTHSKSFAGQIQARFMPTLSETTTLLVEPLTKREVEVLKLIAQGHSNPEIGERLIVATGTVAKHTNSIFGKLSVRNRTEAVSRAQALGLL